MFVWAIRSKTTLDGCSRGHAVRRRHLERPSGALPKGERCLHASSPAPGRVPRRPGEPVIRKLDLPSRARFYILAMVLAGVAAVAVRLPDVAHWNRYDVIAFLGIALAS